MKKLIFALLLVPLPLLAEDVQEVKEEILTDQELSKKFVSTVKDAEVEGKLEKSTEFKSCAEKAKFEPSDDDTARKQKAQKAEDCFAEELGKKGKSDPKALQKLSDSLGLEAYGLVPSKDDKALRDYLANKIYKSLTGIDKAAQADKQKFEGKQLIDQKDFIELYNNHVAKSVMFEISRFCFENLRDINSPNKDSFADHWEKFLNGEDLQEANVKDDGEGGFGKTKFEVGVDKEKSYAEMFNGIGKVGNPDRLGEFFSQCAKMILPLCKKFRDVTAANKSNPTTPNTSTIGANACLTQDRLQKGRTALSHAKKIKEQFEKDLSGGTTVTLDKNMKAKFFQSTAENSYDTISSVTSFDLLEGGKTKGKEDKLLETCGDTPEVDECKGYIVVDDSKDKAQHGLELQLRAKKQIEIAKIKAMDAKSLDEYLEENGYLELKEKLKSSTPEIIAEEIGKIYDAKKDALIASMNAKLGSRQMSKSEYDDKEDKKQLMEDNIKDVATERARIAQVVLFNNIMTGYLKAENKTTGKESRYGSSWKTEQKALEGEAQIGEKYFANYKDSFKDEGSSSQNGTGIEDLGFLDFFLGAPEK